MRYIITFNLLFVFILISLHLFSQKEFIHFKVHEKKPLKLLSPRNDVFVLLKLHTIIDTVQIVIDKPGGQVKAVRKTVLYKCLYDPRENSKDSIIKSQALTNDTLRGGSLFYRQSREGEYIRRVTPYAITF